MRLPTLPLLILASVTTVFAQTPQANKAVGGRPAPAPAAAQPAEQKSADANGVDTIISLVKANMSEALVLKTIQRQNKAYDLTPEDLVKLQKAGVSETVINAMLDPSTASAPSGPPPVAPAAAPTVAPPPAAPPSAAARVAPAAPSGTAAPAALAANSRGASASTASASGCPQQASSAAPAANQQKKPGGMFSSFKDQLKGSAQVAVDGAGSAVNCAAVKGAETSQAKVGSAMDSVSEAPAQKVADLGSTADKTVDASNTTATTATPAAKPAATPVAAKKAPQK